MEDNLVPISIVCFFCKKGRSILMLDLKSKLGVSLLKDYNGSIPRKLFNGDYTPCSECAKRFQKGTLMIAALTDTNTGYPKFGGAYPTGVWALLAKDSPLVESAKKAGLVVNPLPHQPEVSLFLVSPNVVNALLGETNKEVLEHSAPEENL